MIKVALVCDSCGAVIADGISANEVRFRAQAATEGKSSRTCAWRVRASRRLHLRRP